MDELPKEFLVKKDAKRNTVLQKPNEFLQEVLRNETELFDDGTIEILGTSEGGDSNNCCCVGNEMRTLGKNILFEGVAELEELDFDVPKNSEALIEINLIVEDLTEKFDFDLTANIGELQFAHYQENHKEPTKCTITAKYRVVNDTDEKVEVKFELEKFDAESFTVLKNSGIIIFFKCDHCGGGNDMRTYYDDLEIETQFNPEDTNELEHLQLEIPKRSEVIIMLNLLVETKTDTNFDFDVEVESALYNDIELQYAHYQESHKEPTKCSIHAKYRIVNKFCDVDTVKFFIRKLDGHFFTVLNSSGWTTFFRCKQSAC